MSLSTDFVVPEQKYFPRVVTVLCASLSYMCIVKCTLKNRTVDRQTKFESPTGKLSAARGFADVSHNFVGLKMTADMLALGCFPAPSLGITEDMEDPVMEVNYDSNEVTYLYQAIEDKAFMAAIDFLESGKPEVAIEVQTWVTRYEKAVPNKIRWSQLPLHAALVFKAPLKVIQLLVKHYPKAIRCTDDQSMLPLHLAFRHGASDNTLHMLLKEFPQAINARDYKGRDPLMYAPMGDAWKKGEIISMYVENKTGMEKSTDSELEKSLEAESKRVIELEKQNEELMASATQSKMEVSKLQSEVEDMKAKEEEQKKAAAAASKATPVSQSADKKKKKKGLKRVMNALRGKN